MNYHAKIIADSKSPTDIRLTTVEARFPRFILAELNTHRMFSRNSASSRAVPASNNIDNIQAGDWFLPDKFTKNKRGMQADSFLIDEDEFQAGAVWTKACIAATDAAIALNRLGVHKQHVNRLLEPFMWHTVIITATEWSNFYNLRCGPDAQPEMQRIAQLMRYTMLESIPQPVKYDDWHLPYITERDKLEEPDQTRLALISAARCARVSYLTHDGKRDLAKDRELAARLLRDGHLSPFEHPASPLAGTEFVGNFRGWIQYRKLIPGESDILGASFKLEGQSI